MSNLHRLVTGVCCGVVVSLSAPALAQDAPAVIQAGPASSESVAMYGALVLHGVVATSDLRDYAMRNCDDLTAADLAAIQRWLQRTGVYCDWPQ
ncbi:MAG: hypothetical protein IPO19_11415 [Rhodoferax sp.]|nr:hypothetical protein [Rhodoferax sp.]